MIAPVDAALRQLNERGVSRLEHLEVLMVLSCHPEQTWHSEQVAASSAIPLAAVKASLAHLHRHELLELVPGDHPVYRLGPRAELPLLTLIREAHRRDRIAVVNAFYACNLESLRSFASAFRIRRPS